MGRLRIAVILLLVGVTTFTVIATFAKLGAESAEHPGGISLREESIRTSRTGFFGYYARTRTYRGGGLRGGK